MQEQMSRLDNACKKLLALQKTTGKNAKVAFIETNKDDADFLVLLKARLNPYANYKMKKIPSFAYVLESNRSLTFDDYINLLAILASENINDKLRAQTAKSLARGNYKYAEVLEGIISKELALGVDTSVNKALGYPLIPSFDVFLASPLKEGVDVPMPCRAELKLDGVRCTAVCKNKRVTLYTRQGRVMHFPKIEKEILALAKGENLTFDGELITKSRTGISGICNSNLKKGYVDGSDNLIEYVVFDVLLTSQFESKGKTKKQSERTLDLEKRFASHDSERVRLVEGQTVYTIEKLMEINNEYIKNGEEGIIAKDPDAVYHYKRNKAWLKLKAINSATLKIIGTENGKGKRAGKVGSLICTTSCGELIVKVGSGLNDNDVDYFTDNNPMGRFIEVLFNVVIKGRDSNKHSCFLPRYKEIRIDKTEADSLEKILKEHIGKAEIYVS